MRTLSIDIETYSSINLVKAGAYKYASSPDFEILLFAYAFEDDPIEIIDVVSGEKIPSEVVDALTDEGITKVAFNAGFERTCISAFLNMKLRPNSWQCTAVQSAILGLPLSLEGVGQVLGLDAQKMKEGKDLIKYFCVTCKATKTNGGRTRNMPSDSPEKWELFKQYCIRDVEVERAIREKLKKFQIPQKEQELYVLDQEINDRGLRVDMDLVDKAIFCDRQFTLAATEKAYEVTGLENPNSVSQLKTWLKEQGVEVDSLSKKNVEELVGQTEGEVEEALKLRLLMAKTSVKKYEAIERAVCPDGRVHGLFQFYGANRTGRFAGRLVQFQNLPQNHIKDLDLARKLVKDGSLDDIELLFGNVPKLLSELIRTAFIPEEGRRYIVADFSAIEARVIAWLANEKWRMDVFQTHGKIYEASASQMFKVPIEEITKASPLRQKGKIAELALGYGGSVGALTAMGAIDMGLTEDELQPLVHAWRNANPNITKFWWDVDKASLDAVRNRTPQVVGNIKFEYKSAILFIQLPSGRKLSYIKPRIELNKFGRDGLTFEGIGTTKKWERIDTYGPKLVENIVQATARDLLTEAMITVDKAGYPIIAHCHDEIIAEVEEGKGSLDEICELMAQNPKWAEGLPLNADGFECNYYKKD